MTSLIKGQLVKHLSKFARNITPDQISLDVLKGKSELKNIVLNEEVLTEVLELPSWLRIRRATCNRIMVKIRWTQLKSAPIELFIDEIQVELVLTADKPHPKKSNILSSYAMDTGSYGFANKVVEGLSLYVNTLEMHFESGAFGGSLMLSRLTVESRTPGWQHPSDLRQSRLSCSATNRTILYKQVSWQLLRIEASAHVEGVQRSTINAPLRLITSNGRIRIALKKNSTDGSVLHARILMILEDILWVATLPQLQSAIAFYSHIMKLVKAAQGFTAHVSAPLPARTPKNLAPSEASSTAASQMKNNFKMFDFAQTSYHLHVKKIDLHLCDDAHCSNTYPPGWDIESGAMQVTLNLLLIDIYPKTVASSDRSTWVRYFAPNPFTTLLEQNLKANLAKLSQDLDENSRMRLSRCWPQLIAFNVVLRVFDINVQCVSELTTKKDDLFRLFYCDREAKKQFPTEQFLLHMEVANFIHPMTDSLPVPPTMTHVQLGPFNVVFDARTIRWCQYVFSNLTNTFNESDAPQMETLPPTDIRLDILMPKVCFAHLDARVLDFVNKAEIPTGEEFLRNDLLQMNVPSTASGVQEGCQFWLHSSPIWVETDFGEKTKPLTLLTDTPFRASFTLREERVNMYVESRAAISALVDHFQLLQLLRLSNELSLFVDQLNADKKFLSGSRAADPLFLAVIAIPQVNIDLLLTHGPIPSPYERCAAIHENLLEVPSLSGSESGTAREETPLSASLTTAGMSIKKTQSPDLPLAPAEDFPEFPSYIEIDVASTLDETLSITTDVSDEDANFAPLDVPTDDLVYEAAELAEEAVIVDEMIENDRIYKSMMAKNVNVLRARATAITTLVFVNRNDLSVNGQAQSLVLSEELNKLRSDIYTGIQSTLASLTCEESSDPPQIVFHLAALDSASYATLTASARNLNVELHDEVVAHLSPFIDDDIVVENHLRFQLTVTDSKVQIKDPRKKKPFRLLIKEVVLEQEED